MFSLTFKAFVMLVIFLLFQSNLYVVLAREKVLRIAFILNKIPTDPQLLFTA